MADESLETEARSGSSGTTSEEDLSEVLDDDKLPGEYPPDQPMGSFEYGVTPQEQRMPEAVEDRARRERPNFHERLAGSADASTEAAEDVSGDDFATELAPDLSAEEAAVHEREAP